MTAYKVPLTEMPPISLHDDSVRRSISVGGMQIPQLLEELQTHEVELNDAARTLFASDRLQTSDVSRILETVEVSVLNLGFPQGAIISEIHEAAIRLGLSLCPLELGAFFRLQYLDQPEGFWGHPPTQHRAPPGSLTIASAQLTDDDDFPKGFYLRRIKGALWLRGYCSGPDHLWDPMDRLVFCASITIKE